MARKRNSTGLALPLPAFSDLVQGIELGSLADRSPDYIRKLRKDAQAQRNRRLAAEEKVARLELENTELRRRLSAALRVIPPHSNTDKDN